MIRKTLLVVLLLAVVYLLQWGFPQKPFRESSVWQWERSTFFAASLAGLLVGAVRSLRNRSSKPLVPWCVAAASCFPLMLTVDYVREFGWEYAADTLAWGYVLFGLFHGVGFYFFAVLAQWLLKAPAQTRATARS